MATYQEIIASINNEFNPRNNYGETKDNSQQTTNKKSTSKLEDALTGTGSISDLGKTSFKDAVSGLASPEASTPVEGAKELFGNLDIDLSGLNPFKNFGAPGGSGLGGGLSKLGTAATGLAKAASPYIAAAGIAKKGYDFVKGLNDSSAKREEQRRVARIKRRANTDALTSIAAAGRDARATSPQFKALPYGKSSSTKF